jgi:hypothetical protein
MARYSISKSAHVIANGYPRAQHFPAGSTVEVADDLVPSEHWTALDPAAEVAIAARNAAKPLTFAKNGLQMVDRETGAVRVNRIPAGGAWPGNTTW